MDLDARIRGKDCRKRTLRMRQLLAVVVVVVKSPSLVPYKGNWLEDQQENKINPIFWYLPVQRNTETQPSKEFVFAFWPSIGIDTGYEYASP